MRQVALYALAGLIARDRDGEDMEDRIRYARMYAEAFADSELGPPVGTEAWDKQELAK